MVAIDAAALFVGRRVHRRAHLWRIERRDGTVLRFCEWDKEITFDGETYTPQDGVDGTASEKEQGFGVADVELHGILSDSAITEADLWAGLYRGAVITHYEVDARFPYLGFLDKNIFRIARTFWDGRQWGAEIHSLGALLQQRRGRVAERHCGHQFGDALCAFDIPGSGLVATLTISDVPEARREFRVTSPGISVPGNFEGGTAEFITGANAGILVDIHEGYAIAGPSTIGGWILEMPTPYVIEAGDQVKVTPGCIRNWDACQNWHGGGASGAARRYGGFRWMPGTDEVARER